MRRRRLRDAGIGGKMGPRALAAGLIMAALTVAAIVLITGSAGPVAPYSAGTPPVAIMPPASLSAAVSPGMIAGGSGMSETAPSGAPAASGYNNPKVESALAELAAHQRSGGDQAAAGFASGHGLRFRDGRVQVVVEAGSRGGTGAIAGQIAASGGLIETSYRNLVQAMVPVDRLSGLGSSPDITYIRVPSRPQLEAVASEGVAAIAAGAWQNTGYKGSGVKVAVVDTGFAGYDTRVAAGELPAGITVKSFRADGDITGGGEKHGTACAEIVHDTAPGAQLYLVDFGTDVELGNAIDYLVAQGVKIVSASWVFPGSFRGDGQGSIDDLVAGARGNGIFWVSAAGNAAQMHWSGYFNDSNGNGWHNFTSADEGNTIAVQENQQVDVYLTWDHWPTTNQDYDLYLYQGSTIVASSTSTQNGSQAPSESLSYTVPAGQGGNYWIGIYNRSSNGDARFQLYSYQTRLEYETPVGSLGGQPADSASAMTVGAMPFNSTTLEDFSSRGPTIDGRIKPDIAGPDKVSTSTYGNQGFLGTSAATPHAAGAAAILMEANPFLTPAGLQNELENRATDLGIPGKDSWFGSGKLYLGAPPPDTAAPVVTGVQPAGSVTTATATISANYSDPVPASSINTASVTMTMDGSAISGCTVTATSVLCPVSSLTLGPHAIGGSVADNAGHSSPISGGFTVVDAAGPVVSNVRPAGFQAGSFATISADFSDPAPSSSIDAGSISVTLDGTVLSACTASTTGVSCPVSGLASGNHAIGGQVSDNAGHAALISGGFESGTITVSDTIPPHVVYLQPTGVIFSGSTAIIIGYSDIGTGVNTGAISVTLDGAVLTGCSFFTGSASCPVSGLAVGPHSVGGLVRDKAGNAAPVSGSFIVGDNGPPDIASVEPAGTVSGGAATITVTYSDTYSGVNTGAVLVTLDGAGLTGCTVTATQASCPVSGLTLGNHAIGGSAADNAGNTAAISGGFTSVDTVAPVIAGVQPAGVLYGGTAEIVVDFSDPSPSSSIDTGGVVVTLDGAALANCAVDQAGARCPAAGLRYGPHAIGGYAGDKAGNTVSISGGFQIGDNVAPVVSNIQPVGTVTGSAPVIGGGFGDAEPSSGINAGSFSIKLDGQPLAGCQVDQAGFQCPVSGLGEGPHQVAGSVSDNSGNLTSFSNLFTICLGGKPALMLFYRDAYWSSYPDYLAQQLSVTFAIASPAGFAYGVQITGVTNDNGVELMTPLPVIIGDIPALGAAVVDLRYHIPVGTQSWHAGIQATAMDSCGVSYDYP